MPTHLFLGSFSQAKVPWQCLYFLPEPQGQVSLRPTLPQVAGFFGIAFFAGTTRASERVSVITPPPSPKSSSPVVRVEMVPVHFRRLQWRRLGGLADQFDAHELRGHGLAQIGKQRLEELEGFGLVFVAAGRAGRSRGNR